MMIPWKPKYTEHVGCNAEMRNKNNFVGKYTGNVALQTPGSV
jgi:hypothetical protein